MPEFSNDLLFWGVAGAALGFVLGVAAALGVEYALGKALLVWSIKKDGVV